MMKKILAALLCAALLFALAACSGGSGNGDTTDTGSDTKGGDNKKNIKIGVILSVRRTKATPTRTSRESRKP